MIVANASITGPASGNAAKEPAPSAKVAEASARRAAAQPDTPRQAVQSAESASRSEILNDATRRGRLAFDDELSRVFVEIVDRKSGEVVLRFPPEQIVRHMAELSEAKERSAKAEQTGLVLDQVV